MSVDPISDPLLRWYDANARQFPWRQPPGHPVAPDPYRVWLSEIMLQQTGTRAVIPHFERFVARWPDVGALAAATEAEVMAAWAGLGYYSRARNLWQTARLLALHGFPADASELERLPGIGAYTAAAIAAIAFGRRTIPVDANIARVGSRLFAFGDPLPSGRQALGRRLLPHVPETRPGDFAQALMDLGAAICSPKRPGCRACPLHRACEGSRSGQPERWPLKPARSARPVRHGHVWWIEHHGAVAVVRRPPGGPLAGMLALPGSRWLDVLPSLDLPLPSVLPVALGSVRHIFTHFELRLRVHRIDPPSEPRLADGMMWQPIDRLDQAGMPSLYHKVAAVALERRRSITEIPC
jgi:A/G-specific adenine glycosylase